jgi:arabinan endo-1,5-alpha-L-arabinosidase
MNCFPPPIACTTVEMLVPAFLLASLALAYPNPLPCSGTCTDCHDPSLIQDVDGTYWRFSTGNKIAVYSSPNIEGPWTYQGPALPNGSKINLAGNQDLWAPDVSLHGDTYYMYYAVATFGSQNSAIGVATSQSLAGPWQDKGSTGIESYSGDNYNAIDANLLSTNTGMLVTFGSFWADIFQTPMNNPPLSVAGKFNPTNVVLDPTPPQAVEGAFLYNHGSYFYMFYSHGQCCGYTSNKPAPDTTEYMIKVCRSSSATGPFSDVSGKSCLQGGGTVVLESHDYVYGPGGQGVFTDPKLGPVLYYHYINTNIGYADSQVQFGINKLDFSSGWPVAV